MMKIYHAATGLLLAGAVAAVQAQVPVRATLVRDFNTTEVELSSTPRDFVAAEGKVYFSATRPQTGRELYAVAADGQPYLVADLAPGGASSNPRLLGIAGGMLIVAARPGNVQHDELMGPPATYAVNPGDGAYTLLDPFPPEGGGMGTFAGKVLLFSGYDNALLATDGTVQGTQRLLTGLQNNFSSVPRNKDQVCVLPDRILFMARRESGWQLWLSNGQTLGSGPVAALPSLSPVAARAADGGCYFLTARSGGGWDLWLSNGTAGGTGIVAASDNGSAYDLAVVDGAALVLDAPGNQQLRLWRAGSATPLLEYAGADPGRFHASGGHVLIGARTYSGSQPVFVSDGTAAGTRRVEYADGAPLLLAATQGQEVGFANAGAAVLVNDSASYRIDPAAARVQRYDEHAFMYFGETASLGDAVVGAGHAQHSGLEPWRTDGTVAGSWLLADLARANGGSIGTGQAASQGNVLVLSHIDDALADGPHRGGLWRTDGSAAGSWALPRSVYGEGAVGQVQALGHEILFSAATTPVSGVRQLYRTRADFLATTMLPATTPGGADFLQGAGTANAAALFLCGQPQVQYNLCAVGATDDQIVTLQYALAGAPQRIGSVGSFALYFVPGQGLFRSDGTAAGTWFLRSGLRAHRSVSPSYPLRSQPLGARLLFQACEGQACGLWASDGTPGGTAQVMPQSDFIHDYTLLGGRALFLTSGELRPQLWSTDGSSAGTRGITQLARAMTRLITVGTYAHIGGEASTFGDYLVSDGTTAGTRYVPRPSGMFPAFGVPEALDANTAVFACSPSTAGPELCAIDADGGNLRLAADIFPGPNGSLPQFIGRTGDALYFSADDGVHGGELWRVSRPMDALFADGFD
jgi:ELWxxDGT repeat protein